MRWYLKTAGFKVLSTIPGGARLYTFTQRHVTRSTDATIERVQGKIDVGLLYWNWLKAHGHTERVREGQLLDFGAGWHPTIPLLFYSFGAKRQALLDLLPLLTAQQIADTTRFFRQLVSAPNWPARADLQRLPDIPENLEEGTTSLLEKWGISYHAPYAPESGALRGAVDVVFCTQVLLHISRDGLRHCFGMLYDCLKSGGLICGTVHLMDLYSHTDPRITPYNHLKFSPEFWERWVNTPMMPFNRFKARDYRELLVESGFKILHEDINTISATDHAQLNSIKPHPHFDRYTREELAAKHMFFVASKP